jgi:hypothetical protein
MVKYICPTCEKIFNHKGNYIVHINKKNPCKLKIIYKPTLADQNKYDLLIKKIDELENKVKTTEQKNTTLANEIVELKTKYPPKIIHNNTDNSKTLNLIITPSAFGKEDFGFLDGCKSKKILSKGFNSIPTLIKELHFNEDKPEYHNIYIPNWRDKKNILVFDGVEWNLTSRDDVLDDLKEKGIDFIQKTYNELDENNKDDKIIIKKIKRFLESYENGDKFDVLNENLQLVLYNNRKIVEKTRKKCL